MQNSKLRITELDFDSIKTNLTTFLKGQTEFSDYDFEGSGLSILMDILSYNTHYMSYYLNMIANEMFLDSVSQRSSAASIAKHLGYVTKSASGAEAVITVTLVATEADTDDLPATITLPQYTKITTTMLDKSYNFYTLVETTLDSFTPAATSPRTFTKTGITVKEGKYGTIDYIVGASGMEEKYIVPVSKLDTSTLVVKVKQDSSSATQDTYKLYDNISSLTSTAKNYFLQEVEDEKYEVYFGDGILGAKLSEGNVITLEYFSVSGAVANGAGTGDTIAEPKFTIADDITYVRPEAGGNGTATTAVAVTTTATGGVTGAESLDSIKYNAPKSFKSQDRAVTVNDYKTIVLNKYANASSVITWGGEDNDPPDFGKVYIAIKPVTGLTLTKVAKDDVLTILKKYKVLSIVPVVVDPDYTFITADTTVNYNSSISLNTEDTIKNGVLDVIKNYNTDTLSVFEAAFRHSTITRLIDASDDSIRSNVTKLKLKKRIKPPIGTLQGYTGNDTIKFNNSLVKGSLTSDVFDVCTTYLNSKLVDDSAGDINLVDSSGVVVKYAIGSIDYTTGKVTLDALNISKITSGIDYIYITVDIDETDVKPATGQVLTVLDADISVKMVEDVT